MTKHEYGLYKFGDGTGKYVPESTSIPLESTVQMKIVNAIKKAYPHAVLVKFSGGEYQRAGVPDLYVAVDGMSVWIEVKRPGADTTLLQKKFLEKLFLNGVFCGTAECPETALGIIKTCIEHRPVSNGR
jgi:hypothetical protein